MRRHEKQGLFKWQVQRIVNDRAAMVKDESERERLFAWLRDERRYITMRSYGPLAMDAKCKADYIANWKRNARRLHGLMQPLLPA